jgi:hypothetical protein
MISSSRNPPNNRVTVSTNIAIKIPNIATPGRSAQADPDRRNQGYTCQSVYTEINPVTFITICPRYLNQR